MHFEYSFDGWYVIMVMILRYDDDLITWFLWVVDLVIDGMMVHDYFMVNWMFGYYMFLD